MKKFPILKGRRDRPKRLRGEWHLLGAKAATVRGLLKEKQPVPFCRVRTTDRVREGRKTKPHLNGPFGE